MVHLLYGGARRMLKQATISSKSGQLARRKSLNYALIFPENILLTLFFMSMNTIQFLLISVSAKTLINKRQ